jgi:hypothetical protein
VTDTRPWFIFSKLRGTVDEEVAVPSILKSALLWGMDHFLLFNAEALLYSECYEHFLCLMMAMVRELLHFGLYALGRF